MTSDMHHLCREMIDNTLVAGSSVEDDPLLREHLRTCLPCQEYLEAGTRVLAGLGGFSFTVDPSLETTVLHALEMRAHQLTAASLDRKRLAWACAIAVLFAVAGSLLDLRCGDLLASLLHLRTLEVRQSLLTFWVIPSLLPVLLFPLLPVLAGRKERMA